MQLPLILIVPVIAALVALATRKLAPWTTLLGGR